MGARNNRDRQRERPFGQTPDDLAYRVRLAV